MGKSTFYNRLVGGREAIVDNISGVTRDRKYGSTIWNGKKFMCIDTGGFVEGSDDVFEKEIRSQVRLALDEADVIVFMVDATTGLTDMDEDICEMLRRTKKPVMLAVNKVDNPALQLAANEFWSLGFEEVFFIASISGSGTGDLLDSVADKLENVEPLETTLPKLAIVGQPNVGKSSSHISGRVSRPKYCQRWLPVHRRGDCKRSICPHSDDLLWRLYFPFFN